MNEDLASYYNERAKEYDKVYAIPEEQEDLRKATEIFQQLFAGKKVMEIACGTGYWTEQISKTAASVFATDINASVVDIAQRRNHAGIVTFEVADMYILQPGTKYDALFGGFIWSHILVQDIDRFLQTLITFLKPGATLAFIDSKLGTGKYHDTKRIVKTDKHGNTWQTRNLDNGTEHIVLKNFPTAEFLREKLSSFSDDVQYIELEHYWVVSCKLNSPI